MDICNSRNTLVHGPRFLQLGNNLYQICWWLFDNAANILINMTNILMVVWLIRPRVICDWRGLGNSSPCLSWLTGLETEQNAANEINKINEKFKVVIDSRQKRISFRQADHICWSPSTHTGIEYITPKNGIFQDDPTLCLFVASQKRMYISEEKN